MRCYQGGLLKKHSKLVLLSLLPLTILGSYTASADTAPGEQFVISNPPTNDRYTGINLADSSEAKNTNTALEAFTADGTSTDSKMLTRTTCHAVGDPGCETSKYFQYNAQLGLCDSKITTDCVQSVFATDSAGRKLVGSFVENFPGDTAYTYRGDPSIGLPSGASTFIVDFPDLPHPGGTKYLVVAFMQGARGFNESQFHVEYFNSAIFAVSKVAGHYSVSHPEIQVRPDFTLQGRQQLVGGWDFNQNPARLSACVQTTSNTCLLSWPLPVNVKFGLTLKLHEKLAGWLHGRLTEAESSIVPAADGDQLFTYQGKPSVVPGIYGWFKKNNLPASLASFYSSIDPTQVNAGGFGWPANDGTSNGPDGLPYSIIKQGVGYGEGSFKEVLAWINALSDKAAYSQNVWSVHSLQYLGSDSCLKGTDTLSGIVSTNSTMYVGEPPTFNTKDKTLDYKVVSPHYLPDGSEFLGNYDLVIRSDVARCLYKFTLAPISATISVISANGSAQIATTAFNEQDGWIRLAARNFTFSSPTVKVQFQQVDTQAADKAAADKAAADKAAANKAAADKAAADKAAADSAKSQASSISANASNSRKISIVCLKGKLSKVISAVKPTCPAGYKKK